LATGNPMAVYVASKAASEQAVWQWADAHPHVDVTTIHPPFLYGPFVDKFPLPKPDYNAISTNIFIYNLLVPYGTHGPSSWHVDIRDAAAAHVRALDAPPTSVVGRKRILISSPHGLEWDKAVALIAERRPATKGRLITAKAPEAPGDRWNIDFSRAEQVLGLKKEDFHTHEATLLDTVDSILKVDEDWASKGYEIKVPVI